MTISDDEVLHWRDTLLDEWDPWTPRYELDQLATSDRAAFVALCHRLLDDPSPRVRAVALQKLWERGGDPDDAVAQTVRLLPTDNVYLEQLAVAILRDAASPPAIAALVRLAERGAPHALGALAHVARFAPDKLRVVRLASEYLCSREYHLRVTALATLRRFLDPRLWEEVALDAARRYWDEGTFGLLGDYATPRVVPVLRWLYDRIGPGYAESHDIEHAIERIERRARAMA